MTTGWRVYKGACRELAKARDRACIRSSPNTMKAVPNILQTNKQDEAMTEARCFCKLTEERFTGFLITIHSFTYGTKTESHFTFAFSRCTIRTACHTP